MNRGPAYSPASLLSFFGHGTNWDPLPRGTINDQLLNSHACVCYNSIFFCSLFGLGFPPPSRLLVCLSLLLRCGRGFMVQLVRLDPVSLAVSSFFFLVYWRKRSTGVFAKPVCTQIMKCPCSNFGSLSPSLSRVLLKK